MKDLERTLQRPTELFGSRVQLVYVPLGMKRIDDGEGQMVGDSSR